MITRSEELQLLEDALNADYEREDGLAWLCSQGHRSWEEYDQLQGDIQTKIELIERLNHMSNQEYVAAQGMIDD